MSSRVLKADYYLIAPLRIIDLQSFNEGLSAGWKEVRNANEFSIKEHVCDFLGIGSTPGISSIVSPGIRKDLLLQQSGKRVFAYYKGELSLFKEKAVQVENPETGKKKKVMEKVPVTGVEQSLVPETRLELYVSPNRKCALAVICLSKPEEQDCTLEETVMTNYVIHKSDKNQAPYIRLKTGRNPDTKEDVFDISLTLPDIFRNALPDSGYVFDNNARFTTATYIQLDASQPVDKDELEKGLVLAGQSKDYSYDVSRGEYSKIVHLYENIWTYNSLEGLSCMLLRHGDDDNIFIKESENTFRKSYMPLFLATLMADLTYTSALRSLDEIAMNVEEQDRIQEARLILTLSPSNYDHLNVLMKSILAGRDFEHKYEVIKTSIDARRAKIDRDLLDAVEQEKANRQNREARIKERNRKIELLLGFIGLGQVVFAIIQLLGAERVLGDSLAESRFLGILSVIIICIFIFLIALLLTRLFSGNKEKPAAKSQ